MDFTLIIGILGMACILTAFILGQANIWKNDDLAYDLVNLIGSGLLVYYGLLTKGYPFVLLNAVWAIYSLKDVVADIRKKI
ncbi:MAG: hypothetical protein PHD72_00860 [Patescibacteria group bacterium]|nr:hypothetical protein [Patescibacteria group bacterium]